MAGAKRFQCLGTVPIPKQAGERIRRIEGTDSLEHEGVLAEEADGARIVGRELFVWGRWDCVFVEWLNIVQCHRDELEYGSCSFN
eukprot:scaffold24393_cov112-Isochrysis_galbana.AAC.8